MRTVLKNHGEEGTELLACSHFVLLEVNFKLLARQCALFRFGIRVTAKIRWQNTSSETF